MVGTDISSRTPFSHPFQQINRSATFVGTAIVVFALSKKMIKKMQEQDDIEA